MQPAERIVRELLRTVLVLAALSACAGSPTKSTAIGEGQAVRIAKDRCAWTEPFEAAERWRAALHDGQWHVWLTRDRDLREPVVGALDIWIRESDGRAGRCNRPN
jgi:hypothetical protein